MVEGATRSVFEVEARSAGPSAQKPLTAARTAESMPELLNNTAFCELDSGEVHTQGGYRLVQVVRVSDTRTQQT